MWGGGMTRSPKPKRPWISARCSRRGTRSAWRRASRRPRERSRSLERLEGDRFDEAEIGPDLVRLALHVGERALAAEAATTLEEGAKRARLPRIDGTALLCRGLLEGDADVLMASVDAYRAITRPYDLARACESAGTVLNRRGLKDHAIAYLRESAEIYQRLVATRDLSRVESSLRALGAPRGRR